MLTVGWQAGISLMPRCANVKRKQSKTPELRQCQTSGKPRRALGISSSLLKNIGPGKRGGGSKVI